MNGFKLERGMEEQVFHKLPSNSIIVIDNASYHTKLTDESKRPTTATKKVDIQDWLRTNGILMYATQKYCNNKSCNTKVLQQ